MEGPLRLLFELRLMTNVPAPHGDILSAPSFLRGFLVLG
jgi:hypothetical protein